MRKTPIVLLASSALLAPTAVLAASADAATSGISITNCSKTRYGTTVKIRIRDIGDTARVRVSHPDGTSRFENDRVRRTVSGVKYTAPGPAGGVSLDARGNRPTFRIQADRPGKVQVITTFKLRNGKSIFLSCTMR